MNSLEYLRQYSVVVADTGDFHSMRAYLPRDATTNPSLILKAVQKSDYRPLLEETYRAYPNRPAEEIIDRLLVRFGQEILKIIPGRVSTEVDARLSFDTRATIEKARTLIAYYEKIGIDRERVLIKIASTWEGIRAAEVLESEGIHCNMTLLFCMAQAVACAQAKVTLISPFVGRILDWYKKSTGQEYTAQNDPGVLSVTAIYAYYKKLGYPTEIMAASFRSPEQILALAGCDLLTISPELLGQLAKMQIPVERKLDTSSISRELIQPLDLDEAAFRYALNNDAMANEKLAEGIRAFAADAEHLTSVVNSLS